MARLAALELDLRVSALARLGRSRDDGERLVLELAVRDLLAGAAPGPGATLGGRALGRCERGLRMRATRLFLRAALLR